MNNTNISCVPNYTTYQLSSSSDSLIQLCNLNSGCDVFSNVSGKTFIDTVGNGIYDVGDRLIDLLNVNISPGNITTSSMNGNWGYSVDTNVSLIVDTYLNIPYYSVVPFDSYLVRCLQ